MQVNKLAQAFANLITSMMADSTDAVIWDHNVLEQMLFELFVSKGYHTSEARKLAIHVVEAVED